MRAAIGWFSRQAGEISRLAKEASQDATHQQEVHKTLSELLIVFDQLTRIDARNCAGVRRLIGTLARSIDSRYYAESIVRYPSRFRLYGAICGVLARHTHSDVLFQNGLAVAQMGTGHAESSLMRCLDSQFVAREYYAAGDDVPEVLAAARQFLCARHSPHLLTNDYLYAFTHIVFYVTQLGRDAVRVDDLKATSIPSLIRLYTSLCVASGDNDLLSEFILCSMFLDARPTDASILSLSQAQIADGSVPRYSTRSTPATESSFVDSYHTTLVACWALAEFVASARQRHLAAADGAYSELLTAHAVADDLRPNLQSTLSRNFANRAGSLLQHLDLEDVEDDVSTTLRLAELATRAGPRFASQSTALIGKCSRAPISEVVRVADSLVRLEHANDTTAGLREEYLCALEYCLDRQEPLHPIHVMRLWNEGRCPPSALTDAIRESEGRLGALEAVWQELSSRIDCKNSVDRARIASEIAKTLYVQVYRRELPAILEIIEILFNLRTDGDLARALQGVFWMTLFPLAVELISYSGTTLTAVPDSKRQLEYEVNCIVVAGRLMDGLSIAGTAPK